MIEFAPHGLLYLVCGLAVLGLLSWFGLSKGRPPSYYIQREREKRLRAEANAAPPKMQYRPKPIRDAANNHPQLPVKPNTAIVPAKRIRQPIPTTDEKLDADDPDGLKRMIAAAFASSQRKKTTVLTFPQAVVTYRLRRRAGPDETLGVALNAIRGAITMGKHASIKMELGEILATNPKSDLKNYEEALGIEILSVERPNSRGEGGIYV